MSLTTDTPKKLSAPSQDASHEEVVVPLERKNEDAVTWKEIFNKKANPKKNTRSRNQRLT
jgi:hypothetical protein